MRVTQIDYLHETGAKKNQEDFLWPLPGTASGRDRIFIVCDGVGGAEGGEIASRLIAEWVAAGLQKAAPGEIGLPLINALLEEGRARLAEHALLKGLGKDMATTFTLLYLLADRAFVAWCGDSRVYHLRGKEMLFRTTDHSLVHSLVRTGELSEEDAREHPQKNLLLKAIRADEPGPEAEGHWIGNLEEGDYFLLCTDGLLENITDADVVALLQDDGQPGRNPGEDGKPERNLADEFRSYCDNRTRDNYSMYLIRVSPGSVEEVATPVSRRELRPSWLLLLLVLLIAAAAFVIRENYLAPKRANSPAKAITPTKVNAPANAVAPKTEVKIQTVVPVAASAKDTINP